jgi:hypothetical protein
MEFGGGMSKKKRMNRQLSTVSTQLRVRTEKHVFLLTLITVHIGIVTFTCRVSRTGLIAGISGAFQEDRSW